MRRRVLCFNNVQPQYAIIYTAAAKLDETTSTSTAGLHTDAFNTTIKSHTFKNGTGTIAFNDVVTEVNSYAFYGCAITSVTVPNTVTTIGSNAFENCSSLTGYTMGSSVASINQYAFSGCSSLTSITIPNTVTFIGKNAFEGCSGLTSISIPNSIQSILNYTFSSCTSLANVTIGSNVSYIGQEAFAGCSSLQSITSNAITAPEISRYTFYNVNTGGTLYIPSGSTGYSTWLGSGDYYLGKYGWASSTI